MFGIVSDVIAGIGLVKDLKDAASDCSRASDEYNSLVSIIRDLEPLLHCPSLQLEEADPKDLQLYHKVVINIDQSAKNFMSKIEQFDKKLSFDSPGFAKRMSVAFRRMEWSSAKSLVEELKTNLILHNTILMGIGQRITLKMENDRLALQKQQQCQPCGAQNRASMHIPHTSSHPDPTIEHEEASHIMRLEPYYDSNEVHNSLAQSTTNIQERYSLDQQLLRHSLLQMT
ncbi:uncharacterized protein TRUGW13939_09489 [Talaromyces rugulosus]|uniref:Uncharacterized protein n=1 Tax=Talaromyces rugulosus TaxID=121627 RepID=A0A7H8R7H4_TALRU|nr:uncharacterized protein TRUGW13939_09489 [Talaromyces rugulosus]QKX62330.1 hypothetical protein TRUGW13939_09489 [Talaromyces rugulosus]